METAITHDSRWLVPITPCIALWTEERMHRKIDNGERGQIRTTEKQVDAKTLALAPSTYGPGARSGPANGGRSGVLQRAEELSAARWATPVAPRGP